jgi:hypothetical protein
MWIPESRKELTRHDDWLRFNGCIDIPKEHKAFKLQEAGALAPLRSDIAIRQEAFL